MKKFMILMLSLAVLFSFAACDNSTASQLVITAQVLLVLLVVTSLALVFLVVETRYISLVRHLTSMIMSSHSSWLTVKSVRQAQVTLFLRERV